MRLPALLILGLFLPSAAAAQIVKQPSPEPARIAADEAWYRAGEPVLYRGEPFYPGGAPVFFNARVMVPSGEYRGIPLYIDPTIETGSIVLVPIGSGLMQPYERLRAGDLAGTSGSRMPSFPPATASPLVIEPQAVATAGQRLPAAPVGETSGDAVATAPAAPAPSRVVTIAPDATTRPGSGIWISWNGDDWRSSGAAVRVGPQIVPAGVYSGRTIYRGADPDVIWLETAQGLAAPWSKRSR